MISLSHFNVCILKPWKSCTILKLSFQWNWCEQCSQMALGVHITNPNLITDALTHPWNKINSWKSFSYLSTGRITVIVKILPAHRKLKCIKSFLLSSTIGFSLHCKNKRQTQTEGEIYEHHSLSDALKTIWKAWC